MYLSIEGTVLNRLSGKAFLRGEHLSRHPKNARGLWSKRILRRRSNWCKGPGAGDWLVDQRTACG